MKPSHHDLEIILYQTEDKQTRIEVRLQGETAWLSLNQMAELFQRDKSVISKHIRNIFDEGELSPERTVAKFATVQNEGERKVSRQIELYNLDMAIAVTNNVHPVLFPTSSFLVLRTLFQGHWTGDRNLK